MNELINERNGGRKKRKLRQKNVNLTKIGEVISFVEIGKNL